MSKRRNGPIDTDGNALAQLKYETPILPRKPYVPPKATAGSDTPELERLQVERDLLQDELDRLQSAEDDLWLRQFQLAALDEIHKDEERWRDRCKLLEDVLRDALSDRESWFESWAKRARAGLEGY